MWQFSCPTSRSTRLRCTYVALAARGAPECVLIYTDEDRVGSCEGAHAEYRCGPYFKPDWNPDLLLSQDYLGGFVVWRADRIAATLPEALNERAVRQLGLALTETLRASDVVHIPRVLHHRRGAGLSASAEVELVQEAVKARGLDAEVIAERDTALPRIRYGLRQRPPVTVLVATRDRVALLRRALTSVIERTAYNPFDVCVIDNDSADPETLAFLDVLSRRPRFRVVRSPGVFNYAAIHNQAVAETRGDVLVFLNNDTEVLTTDWLEELVSHAMRPSVGAVGARLLFANGTLQHAGVVLGAEGIAGHAFLGHTADTAASRGRADAVQEYSAVTAACMAIRREVFLQVGGFDAGHLAVRFNDVDLCLRLREAGYRNVWTPHAVLRHDHAASIAAEDENQQADERFAREVAYMTARWGAQLSRDPFYNPNLDTRTLDFSLAFPPALPRFELP